MTDVAHHTSIDTAAACELCGLHLPPHPPIVRLEGATHRFCCNGCSHVFLLLAESGLLEGDFRRSELYQTALRLGVIGRPDEEAVPQRSAPESADTRELVLHVDGMWCSSCSWLIEKVVGAMPGVTAARVLYASDTARIRFQPAEVAADTITRRIAQLGYASSSPADDHHAFGPERRSLLMRMGVALFIMMNVMDYSYTLYVGYFERIAPEVASLVPWILWALATPAVFWCGMPIHTKAWQSIRAGAPTMEVLFSLGIAASYAYSAVATVAHGEHVYFDTAVSLVALLLVGKFIELSAKGRASDSVQRLYRMLPAKVRLKAFDGERLVAVEKLAPGDRFVVRSGEKVAADGFIVAGHATLDESLLTGESAPVGKGPGAPVFASTMNVSGAIDVQATGIGHATKLSGIIRLVEGALTHRSPLERAVDRVVRVFVPTVIGVAAVAGSLVLIAGGTVEEALVRAVTVLVIACPCALGMATPLGISAGIGYAARRGILIRDSAAIEHAARVDHVVFDKTGTITEGRFALRDARAWGMTEREALGIAASLEACSNHPIATAIAKRARVQGAALVDVADADVVTGHGIAGTIEGIAWRIGSQRFAGAGALDPDLEQWCERMRAEGATTVFLRGDSAGCAFALADTVRGDARDAVEALRDKGCGVSLLSGDGEATTRAIARSAGIDDVTAHATPEEKIETIRARQRQGVAVAMVGDGVNDAPALAQADLGMALSTGTEIARESAPVTLLRDDLALVPETLDIARRTRNVVRENLAWAMLYNAVGMALAVTGVVSPLVAAAAMLASSLSVVTNSLRLRDRRGTMLKGVLEFLVPWREPKASSPAA